MKNHFSLQRFGLLFRKHTTEHLKSYLMSLAVLVGALFLVIGWIAYISRSPMVSNQQEIFFSFFLMGAGTIFTSTVFSNLSGKNRAIATLMLPASILEKYLVGWLYSFVIFLLLFTGSFYLAMSSILRLDAQPAELLNIFKEGTFALSMLLIYSLLHSVAIWGAVAFEKLSFIKTAFGFFVVVLIVVLINNTAMEGMFGRDLNNTVPFAQVSFQEKEEFYRVALPENLENLAGIVPVALAMLVWLAALVRLKEKQI
jgi:hypothetical protein